MKEHNNELLRKGQFLLLMACAVNQPKQLRSGLLPYISD